MRLFIEQQGLFFNKDFKVHDEAGIQEYDVQGEFITSTLHLKIYDRSGKNVLMLKRKLGLLSYACDLYVENKKIIKVEKEVTFMKPSFVLQGIEWKITGNLMAHNYVISKDGEMIASIEKKMFNLTDTYMVDIKNKENQLYVIGIVLAIDCILFTGQKSSRFMFG